MQPRECFIDSLLRDIKSGLETADGKYRKASTSLEKKLRKLVVRSVLDRIDISHT